MKYTGQYLANRDTYRRYMKSSNKAEFRETHRAEITLYEAARKYLKDEWYLKKQSDVSYIPNNQDLKARKEELTAQKNAQYKDYSYSRAKYRELQTIHRNVHSILDINRNVKEHEPVKETSKAANCLEIWSTNRLSNRIRSYRFSETSELGHPQ